MGTTPVISAFEGWCPIMRNIAMLVIWTHDLWIRKRVCYPLHDSAQHYSVKLVCRWRLVLDLYCNGEMYEWTGAGYIPDRFWGEANIFSPDNFSSPLLIIFQTNHLVIQFYACVTTLGVVLDHETDLTWPWSDLRSTWNRLINEVTRRDLTEI